ncbi:MAG: hypothetical protein ACLFSB_07370 [Chitinispirillaceae bacterium]
MKRICFGCLIVLGAIVFRGWGCLAPANMQGVAFTNEESLDLELLRSLGTEGEHYVVDGEAPQEAVRYRSHYDERAMVYVGTYGLSYQEGLALQCMGVILDPSILEGLYQPPSVEVFDFTAAVVTELQWLVEQGVIDLTDGLIDTIDSALTQASNGGIQYWTLQTDVLGYNSWYRYNEQSGVWSTKGEDVDAVRGVNGGCGVISPEFQNLEALLSSPSTVAPVIRLAGRHEQVSVWHSASSPVLHLANPSQRPLSVKVVSINGKAVARFTIPAGAREYKMSKDMITDLGMTPCFLEVEGVQQKIRFLPNIR